RFFSASVGKRPPRYALVGSFAPCARLTPETVSRRRDVVQAIRPARFVGPEGPPTYPADLTVRKSLGRKHAGVRFRTDRVRPGIVHGISQACVRTRHGAIPARGDRSAQTGFQYTTVSA